MKCEKCQKELPTLGGKWTSRFTFFCHYLGCEVNLCTDCYEHYEKALKVFEHEFLTGSPRECVTMQLNFNKENMKELCDRIVEQIRNGELQLLEGPNGWIPITYRPITEEERIAFAKHYGVEYCDTLEEKVFDCPMPEDGQEILISKSWGVVEDVADNDIDGEGFISYGLEGNGDWDGVEAWMPKPKRYKKEGESDADS